MAMLCPPSASNETSRSVSPRPLYEKLTLSAVTLPLALLAEASVLVILAAEGDDHAHHGHRLVDDRERSPFEALHLLQLGNDPGAIEAEGEVEKRDDAERDQGHLPVDEHRDHQHPAQ